MTQAPATAPLASPPDLLTTALYHAFRTQPPSAARACDPTPTVAALGQWVTADDCLAASVLTSRPATGLILTTRILDCSGTLHYTTTALDAVPIGVRTTLAIPVTPGFLLDCCVSAYGSGLAAGICFVSVALQHTCQSGLPPQNILAQGYVTDLYAVGYPAVAQGAPQASPPVGVSTPPGIRGTNMQSASNNAFDAYFPAGTTAGDLAILLSVSGYPTNTPAGWSLVNQSDSIDTHGYIWQRTLSAGDILTGSVHVTMTGTFDATVGIVTFMGPTHWNPSTAYVYTMDTSGNAGVTGTTAGAGVPNTGDLALYLAGGRINATVAFTRGTFQQATSTHSNTCGCIYTEVLAAAGQVTAVAQFSAGGGSKYSAVLIIQS